MGVVGLVAVVYEKKTEVFFHREVFYAALVAVGGSVFAGFGQVGACPGRCCFVGSFGKDVQFGADVVVEPAYQGEISAMGCPVGLFCLSGHFRQDA